jgi:hypothetical protein
MRSAGFRARPCGPSRNDRRTGLHHPQHQIGRFRPRPRAFDAFQLDRILGLPNAGGVEQRHRPATEIEMHLDHVARGAGIRRHDRRLALGDPIEQRGFAGIGWAGDGDHQTLAQAFAALAVGQCTSDLVGQ